VSERLSQPHPHVLQGLPHLTAQGELIQAPQAPAQGGGPPGGAGGHDQGGAVGQGDCKQGGERSSEAGGAGQYTGIQVQCKAR
jgi:hypothetical protein